ncbi:hypothetical protein QF000_001163 [Paraburkholderia atlantica]|uniref:Uncharacterized protein n=1 Tax=Paraburkholderia atlantica TaxID=2654982 RepID=D5WMZ7_PARAM|nr:hypothetical protein BC1002_6763 [Paraburkholderia atlantica]MBB5415309.1 hypothetical protein [Paraburkholderia atlantica]MBB5424112.1 hypothetical protein [Paraburkholderia atlantica]MBB5509220.1 hypothetical protein [Paraburkholderia atlantica]
MVQTEGNSRLLPGANIVTIKGLVLPGIVHAE